MSSTTILLLGLTVGVPCTLLALAILYHARRSAPMPAADDGWYDDDPEFDAGLDAASSAMASDADTTPSGGQRRSMFAADPMFMELQQTVGELQGQLARQRAALTALLSDQPLRQAMAEAPTMSALPLGPAAPVAPLAPSSAVPSPPAAGPRVTEPPEGGFMTTATLVAAVQQLNAEGLSERAIARRLRVGVEEVRLASRQQERVS